MLILSLHHIPKANDTGFLTLILKFEAETKSLRPRPNGPEARGYEAEAEAKILASRPVWPRGLNISDARAPTPWDGDAANVTQTRPCVSVIFSF